MIFADHPPIRLRTLANASIHKFTYMADQEVEGLALHLEVEYFMRGPTPIVYAVRVWEKDPAGRRKFLPSPNWLLEMLVDAVDTAKLPEGVPT